jgi:hypothetical protein
MATLQCGFDLGPAVLHGVAPRHHPVVEQQDGEGDDDDDADDDDQSQGRCNLSRRGARA